MCVWSCCSSSISLVSVFCRTVKGERDQRSITGPIDGNRINSNYADSSFSLGRWSSLFKIDIQKSQKQDYKWCHVVPGSLCQWCHKHGQHVWQKCQICYKPAFWGNSLVMGEPTWCLDEFKFEAKKCLFCMYIDETTKWTFWMFSLSGQLVSLLQFPFKGVNQKWTINNNFKKSAKTIHFGSFLRSAEGCWSVMCYSLMLLEVGTSDEPFHADVKILGGWNYFRVLALLCT